MRNIRDALTHAIRVEHAAAPRAVAYPVCVRSQPLPAPPRRSCGRRPPGRGAGDRAASVERATASARGERLFARPRRRCYARLWVPLRPPCSWPAAVRRPQVQARLPPLRRPTAQQPWQVGPPVRVAGVAGLAAPASPSSQARVGEEPAHERWEFLQPPERGDDGGLEVVSRYARRVARPRSAEPIGRPRNSGRGRHRTSRLSPGWISRSAAHPAILVKPPKD